MATLFAVVVYAAVTCWQGCSTQKAADAAKTSAEATGTIISSSQKSFEVEQRAWLAVHGAVTLPLPGMRYQLNKPLVARISFVNTGRTPALNVQVVKRHETQNTNGTIPDFATPFDYSTAPPSDFVTLGTVMPSFPTAGDDYADTPFTQKLLKDDFDNIAGSRLHLFLYGKVIYCDVFGKQHWTTYCWHMLGGGGWAVCKNNNEIDTNDNPPPCEKR